MAKNENMTKEENNESERMKIIIMKMKYEEIIAIIAK